MNNIQELLDQLAEKIYLGGDGRNQFAAVEEGDVRIEVEYTMWLEDDDYIEFKSFEIIHYLEDDCDVENASPKIEDEVIWQIRRMAA